MSARFDYARLRGRADRLVARFGVAGTILSRTAGTGPAWDPGIASSASRSCRLVETEYDSADVDGTVVRRDDRRLLVSAASLGGYEIAQGDRISYLGRTGEVISSAPVQPGGVPLIVQVQTRFS